jgi:hypothetical protein
MTIALAGLASGAAVGFLLGEFLGPASLRAIRRPASPRIRSMPAMVGEAEALLASDTRLHGLDITVVPVGRRAVELHGWVLQRSQRAHAQRVVAGGLTDITVVNSLLVHGEDDLIAADLDVISA